MKGCCNHRACLAPPKVSLRRRGRSRGHRGAALAWWQPPKAHSCPSQWLCPGRGWTLQAVPTRTGVPALRPHLPQSQTAPRCSSTSDFPTTLPLGLSFPICRGDVGGSPFGSSVLSFTSRQCTPEGKPVWFLQALLGEKGGGFALILKAPSPGKADWETLKGPRWAAVWTLTPLSSNCQTQSG